MYPKRTKPFGLIFIFVFVFVLSFTASAAAQTKLMRFSIATGGVGGSYYPIGGAIARLISKYVPNVDATAEVTGASVDNLKLLHAGKVGLGMFQTDTAYDALKGTDKFKTTGPFPVRCICNLYSYPSQFITLKDTGINSVQDFRGRRVCTGAAGSGVEFITTRILEGYGIDIQKDLKRERLNWTEAANALKDRKIEALTGISAVPTAAILDLAFTPGIKIKLFRQHPIFR